MVWIIVIAVLLILVMFVVSNYNSLVQLRNKVRNQFSQIDVVLKNRADLIPNIVETVKGYASHESETLEKVIEARNKYVTASTPEDKMNAGNEITGALNKLFALTENYPDLKANTNFLDLQNKLSETEDKIRFARQFYNDAVNKYNNKVEMVPSNIIAGIFHFNTEKLFEVSEEDRQAPKVQF